MKPIRSSLIDFAVDYYKLATGLMMLFTIGMCAFFPFISVDTDPENMLPTNDLERIFHNKTKTDFALSETLVVGIVNDTDPDGVFNPQTLNRVYELTEFAKTLQWYEPKHADSISGVIEADMLGPSLVDHMSQSGPGEIKFEWLMPRPPKSREEALAIRAKAFSNSLLKGRLFSEDGKVMCIYLPLTDKHLSYRITTELEKKIAQMDGVEDYHIAGVPVAEVAIGIEMFSQMTLGSPLAMLVILFLLWFFFRKWRLVILPMLIALCSVLSTMGLMIALGFEVHILSSMIPIFLMCIGAVSSIHILSNFSDVFTMEKGRKETIKAVMHTLFTPILYTSLTTAAGFSSLVFTPIPPAQIFGAFLSIGVMLAWLYTILLVPAYIMMIPEQKLQNFGMFEREKDSKSVLTRTLQGLCDLTFNHAKGLLVIMSVIVAISIWGTLQINVNDNYAKRFVKTHPIRKADMALNKHLDGTYTAYLILEGETAIEHSLMKIKQLSQKLQAYARDIEPEYTNASEIAQKIIALFPLLADQHRLYRNFLDSVIIQISKQTDDVSDEEFFTYEELRAFIGIEKERLKTFKRPDVLHYISQLQHHLEHKRAVGKSTSLVNAVCKVNQEITGGSPDNYRIPDNLRGIAECLMQFQQGHRPNDLWHMVTPDYKKANIWVQLKTGDSNDMKAVVKIVDSYIRNNPPPIKLTHQWAGLHYINLVLQEKLIPSMLRSFLGSFLVVFFMMSFLFRSFRWGSLCMVPLTITILTIYGIIGISGKDYDLPIAVLGVLTLGMAVDFAIHFLQRGRQKYTEHQSWKVTTSVMFAEPARAISRNVLVIAIGFLPLLIGPLVPYKTMGIMLFAIMTLSGLITLIVLPSLLTITERYFFRKKPNDSLNKTEQPQQP